MYILSVLLLMLVLPIVWIAGDRFIFHSSVPAILLVGKWFVFWAVGIRQFTAGLRQFFEPRFTVEKIFGMTGEDARPFVRELGVANISMGTVGVLSLFNPSFVFPMAITAACFYGIAGIRHLADTHRTRNQNVAMASDLIVSLVLLAYIVCETVLRPGFST